MGIRCTTRADQLRSVIEKKFQELDSKIINALTFCGEKAVAFARSRNTYQDQTGNLRSSIGYVIVKNGAVVFNSTFQKVNGPKSGEATEDGSDKGLAYALDVAKQFTNGYVLIVVAGMHYAYYVETLHNLDVISGAKIDTERRLKMIISQL